MQTIEQCWRKGAPSNVKLYKYKQQQYVFRTGTEIGIMNVVELNTDHNTELAILQFPSFFRQYLGRLIFRRALYIKVWDAQKNSDVCSLPNFSSILKRIRHLTSFTDLVVEACLNEASEHVITPTWIPTILCEWLILEFHLVSGHRILEWLDGHKDEISSMEPSAFGEYINGYTS
jgi:hypothetical protein